MERPEIVKIGQFAVISFKGFVFIVNIKNGDFRNLFGSIEEEMSKYREYIISKIKEMDNS